MNKIIYEGQHEGAFFDPLHTCGAENFYPTLKPFFGTFFYVMITEALFFVQFFISGSDFLFMQFFIGQIFCWSNFLFFRLLWYNFQAALTAADMGSLVLLTILLFTMFLWKLHNIHMIVWKLRCILMLDFQKSANTEGSCLMRLLGPGKKSH